MSEGFHLQQEANAGSLERRPICGRRTRFTLLFAILLGTAAACPAEDAAEQANAAEQAKLEEVVIQAKRHAADEQVTQQVQKALANDPWVYSEHVTVTTRDGVVTVEGIVQDTGELFRILRLARKIPGARRVVDRLEMLHNDPDGG